MVYVEGGVQKGLLPHAFSCEYCKISCNEEVTVVEVEVLPSFYFTIYTSINFVNIMLLNIESEGK